VGFAEGEAIRRAFPLLIASLFPDPFLGSRHTCRPLPADSQAMGPAHRQVEVSHLAVRCATGGDLNPDCRGLLRPYIRVARSLAADPRRARIWLLCTAWYSWEPDCFVWEPLPFRRSLSCPTTEGNITRFGEIRSLFRNQENTYPPAWRK